MAPKISYKWRSDPQIALDVTRIIASVDCWMRGSATVSTRTSRLPCQVAAFIVGLPRSSSGVTVTTLGLIAALAGAVWGRWVAVAFLVVILGDSRRLGAGRPGDGAGATTSRRRGGPRVTDGWPFRTRTSTLTTEL